MAMIQCGECKRDISDKALTCPGCGVPITAGIASGGRQKVETTRGGAKYEMSGFAMIIVGMIMAMGSDGAAGQVGGWMAGIGFCVFLLGRFN